MWGGSRRLSGRFPVSEWVDWWCFYNRCKTEQNENRFPWIKKSRCHYAINKYKRFPQQHLHLMSCLLLYPDATPHMKRSRDFLVVVDALDPVNLLLISSYDKVKLQKMSILNCLPFIWSLCLKTAKCVKSKCLLWNRQLQVKNYNNNNTLYSNSIFKNRQTLTAKQNAVRENNRQEATWQEDQTSTLRFATYKLDHIKAVKGQ